MNVIALECSRFATFFEKAFVRRVKVACDASGFASGWDARRV
jgi:hypothetical protein